MAIQKIVGMKKSDFDVLISEKKEIFLRPARLIPVYKPGDEMALTSIFLRSLCLIKEFKDLFFSEIKVSKSGKLYTYTEVVFTQNKDIRIDGLLLEVKSDIIKDAVIFEMKNKSNEIDKAQIEKYIQLAKNLQIPKLVTISNQFVSKPTQFPISIKSPKHVDLYHFSWSYLLTIAHVLLFENETNISDPDQIEIMKEVVAYLENNISGVCGFTKMKPGWKEVVDKINSRSSLKCSDISVIDTVTSWQQEERDMALILSRKLGLFVNTGSTKYKNDLQLRIDDDIKSLINNNQLVSTLKIAGAVSDIQIKALFQPRTIEMSVRVNVPLDKTIRGQVGWLKRQIDKCQKKNEGKFKELNPDIKIDINIKHAKGLYRIPLGKLETVYIELKDKEIKEFGIVLVKDFGKGFSSSMKFVEIIETMLLDYYKVIVQYLSNWEKPAPKIPETEKENIE